MKSHHKSLVMHNSFNNFLVMMTQKIIIQMIHESINNLGQPEKSFHHNHKNRESYYESIKVSQKS
jgi:hypothetical protein